MTADARPILRASPDSLRTRWTFEPSTPSLRTRAKRLLARQGRIAPPASATIRPVEGASRWNALFLYSPSAVLDGDQRQILRRVRALAGQLLVVIATPTVDRLPPEVDIADAIIWKALPGFDFSAYALALAAVATRSAGATVYLQNDSVLGPFGDLDALVATAPWDLTGFMASPAYENHLNSFAFVLRDVTRDRVAALAPALSERWSYADFDAVVLLQETRLARCAARRMSAGSLWYLPTRPEEPSLVARTCRRLLRARDAPVPLDLRGDAMLGMPLTLLDAGFPFLKRSLFGKFAAIADLELTKAKLGQLGWHASKVW